jgi:hypothetical protein
VEDSKSQINQFLATAETVDAKLSTAAIGLDIIRRKAANAGLPRGDSQTVNFSLERSRRFNSLVARRLPTQGSASLHPGLLISVTPSAYSQMAPPNKNSTPYTVFFTLYTYATGRILLPEPASMAYSLGLKFAEICDRCRLAKGDAKERRGDTECCENRSLESAGNFGDATAASAMIYRYF